MDYYDNLWIEMTQTLLYIYVMEMVIIYLPVLGVFLGLCVNCNTADYHDGLSPVHPVSYVGHTL